MRWRAFLIELWERKPALGYTWVTLEEEFAGTHACPLGPICCEVFELRTTPFLQRLRLSLS